MEQPTATQAAPETRYKVHSSYLWLGSLGAIVALFFVMLVSCGGSGISLLMDPDVGGIGALIFLGGMGTFFIVIAAVVVLTRYFSYKHLYFTIGQDEFNLFSGVFSKRRVHVPYARIQSVDQHATLLQRVFGVCTVSIDTAGGASNKAIQVPYLTKQQAEWLRSQLFTRKMQMEAGAATSTALEAEAQPRQPETGNVLDVGRQVWDEVGGVFAGTYQDAAPVTFEYGLTNKELILAGLSNNTAFAAIIAAIVGVVAQFADLSTDAFVDESVRLYDDVYASVSAGDILSSSIFGIIGLIVGIMVVVWGVSAVASCINYGGFRARRRGPRIEVEHGLLQHTLQGVNIDRVQAVVIKQTFIRRLIGYCELSLARVDAAGDQSEGSQKNAQAQTGVVIHPFLKLARANEILSGLVPEYKDVPQKPVPVARKALRRAITRRAIWQGNGFWCAVCVAVAQVLIHLLVPLDDTLTSADLAAVFSVTDIICTFGYILAVIFFVFDIVGAVLWARGSSFAYNRRFMQVTNAGLARETMNFPRQKIQYGTVRTNPLQRLAGTATIKARTAAGVGGTTIALIDVTQDDADAWLTWIEPRHADAASAGSPAASASAATQGA